MDDVDKAIIDRFRQAGPSLIKLERRSANRAVHGVFTGSMNSVEWSGDWSGLNWTTGLDYWTGVEYWTETASGL